MTLQGNLFDGYAVILDNYEYGDWQMRVIKMLGSAAFTLLVLFGPQASNVVTATPPAVAAAVHGAAPVPVAVTESIAPACSTDELCPDSGTYLPAPCGRTGQDSDRSIVDRRARYSILNEGTASSPIAVGVSETVTHYQGNGASRYLDDLKSKLRRCGPMTEDGLRTEHWLASAHSNRLVIEFRWKTTEEPQIGLTSGTYLILVQRVGDYVAVVRDDGWEGFPSKRSTLDGAMKALLSNMR